MNRRESSWQIQKNMGVYDRRTEGPENMLKKTIILLLLLAGGLFAGHGQGFLNLNLESASTNGLSGGFIPTANAFPDWAAYYGPPGNPTQVNASIVAYDSTTLGAALVILVDSNNAPVGAPLPLQGDYSALLEGSTPAAASTASLGQTGEIPSTAQSLTFWVAEGTPDVSFNGQALSLIDVSNALNYTVYGADISPFAGQTGQLLFTAPVERDDLLDNIQFSTSPVPEPGALGLSALGGLFFVWRNRRMIRGFRRIGE